MDPKRFRDTYGRLQALDDRLTHRIRRRGRGTLRAPTLEEVDEGLRDLGEYTVELKEILRELFLAIGSKPQASPRADAGGGS